MLTLSGKWLSALAAQPETGMGYHVVSIQLKDGRKFDQVVVVEGNITQIRGRPDIPFQESDVADITVTHQKWDFPRSRS
jgi:hypothetical protein